MPVSSPRAVQPEVDRVVTACIFAIATGRWDAGGAVPSVRVGAEEWSVSPSTVHQAYRILADRGILRSEPRRGYFVRSSDSVARLTRRGEAMSEIFEAAWELVQAHPDQSPLGVFRYMLREAERRASLEPECAFVECTAAQAERHAREIERRFAVPCRALELEDLTGAGWHRGLRALLTTAFHVDEVDAAAEPLGLPTLSVPLAPSAADIRKVADGAAFVAILCLDPEQGRLVANDMRAVLLDAMPDAVVRETSVAGLEGELIMTLGSPGQPAPGTAVVLSMSLWDALTEPWRRTGATHPYPYCIDPDSWTEVAAHLGLVAT